MTQEEKLVQIEILHTRFLQSESEYFMKVGLQLEHHQNSIIAKNMLVIVHHTLSWCMLNIFPTFPNNSRGTIGSQELIHHRQSLGGRCDGV